MTELQSYPSEPAGSGPQTPSADRSPITRIAVPASVVVAAVVIWGGYVGHWKWAGLNGKTATLWDWLHLLLLPLAVAVLPLWLSRSARLKRTHKLIGAGALVGLAIAGVCGYAIPWKWTGFVGNRLWDWLELLALPVAVALAPVYRELRENWRPRHSLIVGAALTVFVAIAIGGYVGDWSWTGFRGNTAWDWLQLLLLPLLIPTVIVPALMPMATAGVTFVETSAEPRPLRPAVGRGLGALPQRDPE
jgi:putative effector of murein hydrolase LrgA (UPF0299 family)